jgi:hypothetical protein
VRYYWNAEYPLIRSSSIDSIPKQLAELRVPFSGYVDKFNHFVTDSMAAILSGARKFSFGLVLAHQDMQQVQRHDAGIATARRATPGRGSASACRTAM